jgi:LmbE family N-acetylglucosaminyl deacetylase
MPERILVIAAHPDDEVLGCGGTIAYHASRNEKVRIVFLAEGVLARFDPSEFDRDDVKAASQQRNANAYKAAAVLGVAADEVFLSSRPCCRLDQVPQIDLAKEIERHLADFRPTRLFTHAAHDVNIDHRMAHAAVITATRPVGGTAPGMILSFEVLSSTEWNTAAPFAPQVFQDIAPFIDRKIEALAAYEDEMRPPPHPRSPEVLKALSVFRGAQAGLRHAEAFSLVRAIL